MTAEEKKEIRKGKYDIFLKKYGQFHGFLFFNFMIPTINITLFCWFGVFMKINLKIINEFFFYLFEIKIKCVKLGLEFFISTKCLKSKSKVLSPANFSKFLLNGGLEPKDKADF